MHTFKKIILLVGALLIASVILLAIWAVRYYETDTVTPVQTQPETEISTEEPLPLRTETGTIININDNKLTIEIATGTEKQVVISSSTLVYARYTPETGTSTRMEVSLDDLSVGNPIDVTHRHGSFPVLTEVETLTYYTDQPLGLDSYDFSMMVSVVDLDITNRILSASRVDKNGSLSFASDSNLPDIQLAENLTIATVDDLGRAHISHARNITDLTLEDIRAGDVIALVSPSVSYAGPIDTVVLLAN